MPNTYKKIATVVVGSGGAASIDFTSIPQTFTDLMILTSIRSDRASQDTSSAGVSFNNTTSNRTMRDIEADGSNASSGNVTQFYVRIPASTSTASVFGNAVIYIPNYTSANHKSVSLDSVQENNATRSFLNLMAGLWADTSAINRITLTENNGANFAQHTTATLYGIGDVTASKFAKATGGLITYDSTYVYHTFTSSGVFTPNTALTVDYLVVAGGGPGGTGGRGGGGGAGGYRTGTLSVTTGNKTVTVGAGGAGESNGSNSVFDSITSTGGGEGGNYLNQNGSSGGSGGGGGGDTSTGGAGTSGQGNSGGNGASFAGGGGGGAGAAGVIGSGTANGGDGLASSISGISVTYAGGGGGGSESKSGNGGAGGGGNYSQSVNNPGTVNTGGGGGAGVNPSSSGGSGIVIVRYAR